jgi:hypothetical protein
MSGPVAMTTRLNGASNREFSTSQLLEARDDMEEEEEVRTRYVGLSLHLRKRQEGPHATHHRHVLREQKRTSIIYSVSANRFFSSRSWKLKLTCVSLYGMDDATWRGRIVNGFKEGDEKNEGG